MNESGGDRPGAHGRRGVAGDEYAADEVGLRSLLEVLPDPIVGFVAVRAGADVVDLRVTFVNAAAGRVFGRDSHEAVGGGLLELLPVVEQLGVFEFCVNCLVTGKPGVMRLPPVVRDGVVRLFDLSTAVLGDELVAVAHDVTSSLAAEERRQAILESMLDPHVLLQAVRDQDGAVIDFEYADANTAACEYMGMAPGDLVGARLLDLLPGQAGSGMFALYAGAVESGDALVLDDYAYPHEIVQDERRYDIRAVKVGDALSFTWRDVTDRHRQAEALATSEQRYRLLAENASDVVAQSSPDGTIEWVSASVTALLGWAPSDLIGQRIFEYLHPDDVPDILAAQGRMAHGEPLRFNARVRLADGGYRWVASNVRPVFDESGAVIGRVAGWRDVHDEHLAAEALAESEDLFRTAMDNSAVGMCLVAPDGRFLRVNPALCQMLDRTAEELMAATWQELTHPDDVGVDQDLVAEVLSGDRDSYRLRKRYLHPDGGVVWGDLAVSCVRHPDGTVRHFISQITDVTEAHQAMLAVQQAEDRFRLLAENSSDVVFTAGPDRLITWVTPNITAALGWEPTDWVGRVAAEFVHPEDLRQAAQSLAALYAARGGSASFPFRGRWRTPDGSYRWMLGLATRMPTDDGHLDYVVAGLRDITAEVTAQDYLTSVLDSAIDPHIMFTPVHDDNGRIIDFEYAGLNPAACAYRHTTREAVIGKRLLEEFGGEASHTLLGWCADSLTTGVPVVLDDQAMVSEVTRDTLWFDVRAVPVNGQVSLTYRDVTARHRQAAQVAASEEKFRLLAENATDAVLHARDGIMVWLSPSLTTVLGWAPEDWVGHRFEEFTHPDDVAIARSCRSEIESGNTLVTRLRLRDNSGDFHWAEVHASPFVGRDGVTDGVGASFRIIDVQVQAEKILEDRARYDELTGLLNRAEVFERLRVLLDQQARTGHDIAVAFCDLDEFKHINDTYGHQMGDHVLQTVARDVRALLREEDLIARLGGDEILLVLTGVHGFDGAVDVAQKVLDRVGQPRRYRDTVYTPRLSIGVTLLGRGEQPDDVIARADRAMYAAKKAGGNQVHAA